ncbi:acyl-CoA carboxylase epsilon subunit [Amycolatopsis echigonensis]|uniref:acyl-CoA carboxylase epsilon subunit n=1 Tax=Amycolatopsis echigonensis TaxID=2576905 RepID=UPI001ABFE1D3|nr:acyl-CoA carboxylase epsilon subunit [Amycolatopsis niigatensis]
MVADPGPGAEVRAPGGAGSSPRVRGGSAAAESPAGQEALAGVPGGSGAAEIPAEPGDSADFGPAGELDGRRAAVATTADAVGTELLVSAVESAGTPVASGADGKELPAEQRHLADLDPVGARRERRDVTAGCADAASPKLPAASAGAAGVGVSAVQGGLAGAGSAGGRGALHGSVAVSAGSARAQAPAVRGGSAGRGSAGDRVRGSVAGSADPATVEAPGVQGGSVGYASGGGREVQRDVITVSTDAGRTKAPAAQGDSTDQAAARVRGEQRAAAVAPAVRVVRGNPDDAEVAALLVALAAVGRAAGNGRADIAVPSPRQPLTRFVPATSWRAR